MCSGLGRFVNEFDRFASGPDKLDIGLDRLAKGLDRLAKVFLSIFNTGLVRFLMELFCDLFRKQWLECSPITDKVSLHSPY